MSPSAISRDTMDRDDLRQIAEVCSVSEIQIEDVYACTHLQINCIAESSIRSGANMYHIIFSLAPSVDLDLLHLSLQKVVSLYPILRTRIVDTRLGLVQVIIAEEHSTQHLSGDVVRYIKNLNQHPINLGDRLFRSAIINRKLVLTMHHSIMDSTSRHFLLSDMMHLYHGHELKVRVPFKEFVAYCNNIEESSARSFWAPRFKGIPTIYPQVEPSYDPRASKQIFRMIEFSEINADVSPAHIPSFVEAAWALMLGTYTGRKSIAYGLALSGRTLAFSKAETTMGPTVAIVPVQVKLQPCMTIREILKERATALRELQSHPALQYSPSKIAEMSEAARFASRFQAVLSMTMPTPKLGDSDLVAYKDMDEPAEAFSICFHCIFMNHGIWVEAKFDPAVVCELQMSRLIRQFQHTLRALMEAELQAKVETLPLLNRDDLSQIVLWNSNVATTIEKCLHGLFRERVQERPTAMAVQAADGRVTYEELDRLSDRLAYELHRRGLKVNCSVAFIFEKSMWAIVAMLSILKAGGVCVPIDRSNPPARKMALISRVKSTIILVSSSEAASLVGLGSDILEVSASSMDELPDVTEKIKYLPSVSPEDLAFIMFTSGSTGTPKGVMLEHRCLASSLFAIAKRFGWQPGFRILQFASHVWDASIIETFGALLIGGCLYVPSEEERVTNLAHFIQSNEIDCACLTPTVLRTISPNDVPRLKLLMSGGEPVSTMAFKTWGEALRLINGWGPCEASLVSTTAELMPVSPYPETIGTPLNCSIWLVNPENIDELVPVGAIGEILIEGPGVARGYLDDPVKSATAFVAPPRWTMPHENKRSRFYRTGDMAKYNPDGSICFLGRRDTQVKIRGQRFELGEVESVLANCNQVENICVFTNICNGRTVLVAVVCLQVPQLPRQEVLQELSFPYDKIAAQYLANVRDFAGHRLPSYMIPTLWIAVEKMPQTSSAKLDRAAVIEWSKKRDLASTGIALDSLRDVKLTPPGTDQERLVQSVWASVLNIPEETIGRESCFLQLGGDSMLAMQAANRCQKRGLPISTIAMLKDLPLAALVENAFATNGSSNPTTSGGQVDAINTQLSQFTLTHTNAHICMENVESIAPATDLQSIMLSIGQPGVNGFAGYHVYFTLQFTTTLDMAELRQACKQVMIHHPILRTTFVQQGAVLLQVVFKNLHAEAVIEEEDYHASPGTFRRGMALARFRLFSDGRKNCGRVRLEIHHALYDAVSLSLVFRDIDAAYTNKPLSEGPHFHSWISYVTSLDGTTPRQFWADALRGSSVTCLATPRIVPTRLSDCVKISVPSKSIQTPLATSSSVMKALWALVLSNAVSTADVVFGEVSANRYLMPGIEQVRGPCVNLVPIRARLDKATTLASLIKQMQDYETASLPYHHVGIRSIVKDCTSWPRWAKFSSTLVYENHRSIDVFGSIRIGNADGAMSADTPQAADSADVFVVATPGQENLQIELYFNHETIPHDRMNWISQSLTMLLHAALSSLEMTLGSLGASILETVGSYVMPPAPSAELPSQHYHRPSPSIGARDVAWQAWKEVELLAINQDQNCSMFSGDADIVTTLLLSEYYRSCGYDITADDIRHNPSRVMQARLLDEKGTEKQTLPSGIGN